MDSPAFFGEVDTDFRADEAGGAGDEEVHGEKLKLGQTAGGLAPFETALGWGHSPGGTGRGAGVNWES